MLVLTKNDKLIAAVCRIKSHHKNVGNLVPKVIYHNENTDICGVFYDADKKILVYVYIKNNNIVTAYKAIPIHVEYSDKNRNYAYSDDELRNLRECDFCGEADDLSCYVYFNCVNLDTE